MSHNIVTESVQQFNLRWTNYSNNFLEVLVDKFNKGTLTDVTLCCEGNLIRAHKMVLAASSTFFEHLFDIYNESNPLIILNGVPLTELKMLIQFMYRGEMIVREDEVEGILKLSHELQVKGLSDTKFNSMFSKSFKTKLKEEGKDSHVNPQIPEPVNDKKNVRKEDAKDFSTRLSPSPVKISVPANAFALYTEMMKTRLSVIYPAESYSEISARITALWRNLSHNEKIHFYEVAKRHIGESEASRTIGPVPHDVSVNISSKRKRDIGAPRVTSETNTCVPEKSSTIEIDDDIELIEDDKDLKEEDKKVHEIV
ncbi:hypothetical protein Trydic_g435 [Trypoxylus dichotomus]